MSHIGNKAYHNQERSQVARINECGGESLLRQSVYADVKSYIPNRFGAWPSFDIYIYTGFLWFEFLFDIHIGLLLTHTGSLGAIVRAYIPNRSGMTIIESTHWSFWRCLVFALGLFLDVYRSLLMYVMHGHTGLFCECMVSFLVYFHEYTQFFVTYAIYFQSRDRVDEFCFLKPTNWFCTISYLHSPREVLLQIIPFMMVTPPPSFPRPFQ